MLAPSEGNLIPISIAMGSRGSYVGLVFARSGLASRRDLAPANKVSVVDSDYRGNSSSPCATTVHNRRPSSRASALPSSSYTYLTAQFFETGTLTDTTRGEGGWLHGGEIMASFLPIRARDARPRLGPADFVYVLGDAYVDHPSFGHAIISRVLGRAGLPCGHAAAAGLARSVVCAGVWQAAPRLPL